MRKSFTRFLSLALLICCFGFTTAAYAQCTLTTSNVGLVNPDVSTKCDGNDLQYQVTGFTAATGYHYEYAFNLDATPGGGYSDDNKVIVPEGSTFKVKVRLIKDLDLSVSCESTEIEVTAYNVAPLVLGTTEVDQPKCFGDLGEITIFKSGGEAPFLYYVVPGPEFTNNSGVVTLDHALSTYLVASSHVLRAPGNYFVSVNNQAGCVDLTKRSKWEKVTINPAPSQIVVNAVQSTAVTCNNGADASIAVDVSGGTPDVNGHYSVTLGGVTHTTITISGDGSFEGIDFTGLSAGTYTATVKDANGCTITSSPVTLSNPTPIKFTIAVNDVTCAAGANGAITAIIDPTSPESTYSASVDNGATWVSDNGVGDLDATSGKIKVGGLLAKYYSLIVKNITCGPVAYINPNGTGNVIAVQAPSSIAYTVTYPTTALCNGASGTITISGVSGGSGLYEYSFDGGATYGSLLTSSKPAGTYNISVRDKNATTCAIPYAPITLTQTSAVGIGLAAAPTAPTCFGGNDGVIIVTASGGNGIYQYSIDNIYWTSNNVFTKATGAYTVYVRDSKNCGAVSTKSQSATVPAITPSAISVSASTPATCNGAADGTITVTKNTWQAGRTVTLYLATSLAEVGVTGIAKGTLSSPITITGLAAGDYYLWAKDEFGCTASAASKVTIAQPVLFSLVSATVTAQAKCIGGNDGEITVVVNAEAVSSFYAIANSVAALSAAPYIAIPASKTAKINVGAGTYYIRVKDGCGVTYTSAALTVTSWSAVAVASTPVSIVNVTCFGDKGTATVAAATGGSGDFTYKLLKVISGTDVWQYNNTPLNSPVFTNLAVFDQYKVKVTDNVCKVDVYTSAFAITGPTVDLSATSTKIQDISCFGANDGKIRITAAGGSASTYEFQIGTTDWQAMPAAVEGTSIKDVVITAAGSYVVKVRDTKLCKTITLPAVTIAEPAAVLLTLAKTDVKSNCSLDGTITATVSGGNIFSGTYNIFFGDVLKGTTSAGVLTVSGLGAGDYTVKAVEVGGKGCLNVKSISITQPSTLSATVTGTTNVKCKSGNNGSIAVSVTGGTGPYTVNLGGTATVSNVNVASTTSFSTLKAGVYTLQVIDAVGCTFSPANVTITEPAVLTLSAVKLNNIGCTVKGKFKISAAGGTGLYSYYYAPANPVTGHVLLADIPAANTVWTPAIADGTLTAEVTSAATYVVWVKDANGCVTGGEVDDLGAVVNEWRVKINVDVNPITYTETKVDATCNGGNGSISVSGILGGQNTNYLVTIGGVAVSPVSGTYTRSLVAGVYPILVTDGLGDCSTAKSLEVKQPTAVAVTLAKKDGSFTCPDVIEGYVEATATGGVVGTTYSYQLWRDGVLFTDWQNTNSFLVQINHKYVVKVKTTQDCAPYAVSNEVSIDPITPVTFDIADVTCYNAAANATASAKISAFGQKDRTFLVTYKLNTDASYSAPVALNATTNSGTLTGLKFADITETQNFYYFKVIDSKGCESTVKSQSFVAVQHPLEADIKSSTDGLSADMTITGGTSPYTYKVGSGELQNAASNDMKQLVKLQSPASLVTITDAHGCTITKTIDVAPISVTASPASGDNLKNNFDVVLTFNRIVTIAAGDITGGIVVPGTGTVFTVSMTGVDKAVLPLALGTNIKDAADNKFAGKTFTYTVGDNTPPKVTVTPPATSPATKVFTVGLAFDEEVSGVVVGSGMIVTGATSVVVDASVNNKYTLTVTAPEKTLVTLNLTAGIKDVSPNMNTLAPQILTFTTGDFSAPTIVSTNPISGSTIANAHPAAFEAVVDETVVKGTGKLTVYKSIGDVKTIELDASTAVITAIGSSNKISVPLPSTLDKYTEYYILLDEGFVADANGNKIPAITSKVLWTFTTGNFATAIDTKGAKFMVYPNPFDNVVNLVSPVKLSKVIVTNIAGQTVKMVVNPSNSINLSELRSGIYFMSLYNADNVIENTAKIVKR
jgi:hypothetical protein